MAMKSINPFNGELVEQCHAWDRSQLDAALSRTAEAAVHWSQTSLEYRCELLRGLAEKLRAEREECAALITSEMGKCLTEARAEVDKCAWLCEHYADTAAAGLADEAIETDARRSYVHYAPLGTVLGIMPWNFPFWQVIRFATAAITAGNTALLKHAGNVPACARRLEALFLAAGFPEDVFMHLPIEVEQVRGVIEDERVHAVTLTGSERAGATVAGQAGAALKKTVLELGGSDAFIVLEDADLDEAVKWGLKSRFQASGQSCIAAKRFILDARIADDFLARFRAGAEALTMGDPMAEETTLGPMARADLREELHAQVSDALAQGARPLLGCELPEGPGCFYPASIIDGITPDMRAWREELFGPVASMIRVADEDEALQVANDNPYGLGGSIWTQDLARGERLALRLASGGAYVNAMTKSDPRTPFGGIKRSGYGRELGVFGLREFVNIRTIWLA